MEVGAPVKAPEPEPAVATTLPEGLPPPHEAAEHEDGSLPPLTITTAADISLESQFDVIVNSISPEFQSASTDSGINLSVWKALTGYDEAAGQEKPGPIVYDQDPFTANNGAAPTYGDVLWSGVPPSGTCPVRYVVHALAPDLSKRPKRLPSGLAKDEAYGALFAAYFRAMWQATLVGGRHCNIGIPSLGSGVFANDRADVQSAAVLAHAAYRASGGVAFVHIVLRPGRDGGPHRDMSSWEAAVATAPVDDSQLLMKLMDALGSAGHSTVLSRVPKARTTGELTELLEAAAMRCSESTAPPNPDIPGVESVDGSEVGDKAGGNSEQVAQDAKAFLIARKDKDKAQQQKLKEQLGTQFTVYEVLVPWLCMMLYLGVGVIHIAHARSMFHCVACESQLKSYAQTLTTLLYLFSTTTNLASCCILAVAGTWDPLLSSLASQLDSSSPFGTLASIWCGGAARAV